MYTQRVWKTAGVLSGLLWLASAGVQAAAPLEFPLDIKFETNKADIKAGAETDNEIKRLMDQLQQYPKAKVEIQGYADATGPDDVNKRLSLQRAEAVRQRLIQTQGLAPDRVFTVARGEEKAPLANETEMARSKNRQVIARIVKVEEGKTQAPGVHQHQ